MSIREGSLLHKLKEGIKGNFVTAVALYFTEVAGNSRTECERVWLGFIDYRQLLLAWVLESLARRHAEKIFFLRRTPQKC